ncbi:hypothetical protein Ddye_027664 [Dipteronia dyeriana]|uniref:TFIIS central domain-containing protein n=1 Tax=Dipteronia dyeriana TaxID=168575 RepID=A0AAD9WQD6_9ROSI|nr:hypothetical protein Ddye_027664 [Dipteronia dyeriana]
MEGERELMLLLESAVNAAEAAAKEEEEVSKDFPITVDVLLSTQIDKHLTHLKNHQREKIRLMAVWLLEIWSNKIKDDRSSSSRNRDDVLNVISSSHQSSGNYKRKPETCDVMVPETKRNRLLAQGDSGFKKPPKERPSRVSKEISNNSTSDASRNKVREILLEAFSRVAREVSRREEEVKERVKGCDPVSVAASVESVMFNKMGPYNGAKELKYRSIMFNIKDPENPDLRRKILLGDIKP